MSILKMEEMTWKEVESLDKKKSIIFVALSPIEEHGPHLPLGTDYICAKDLLKETVNNLEKQNKEYNYIIHPSFPIGYNECVMNYPGTISFRSKTIENVIVDFGESISRSGFSKVVIVNYHLDLGHIKAIENAKSILNTNYSLKVLEVASSLLYSESEKNNKQILNDSLDMKKEIHADFRETCSMLYNHPRLVRDCYKYLEPVYMDIVEFIKSGGKCWKKYGIKEGYIGTPAESSKEQGKIQFKDMVQKLSELILNFIINEHIPELSKEIKSAMNYMVLR